jgi:hypothetical protein
MATSQPVSEIDILPLLTLGWDRQAEAFSFSINACLLAALVALLTIAILWRLWSGGFSLRRFEIDEAEFGIGASKFRLRPNLTDRQVAYAIWVELSTRKIGLPIDLDHDVVAEIYDSWYNFFSVTRDLLKSIPVSKVRSGSTQRIIKLSIEVLNEGLRPHLTHWQARFRAWYDRELKRFDASKTKRSLDPQQLQATFPEFDQLKCDLLRVNDALIRYRAKMRELVLRD